MTIVLSTLSSQPDITTSNRPSEPRRINFFETYVSKTIILKFLLSLVMIKFIVWRRKE